MIKSDSGQILARATAIINHELFINGESAGFIGNVESVNNYEAFKKVITESEEWLEHRGIKTVLAPINFCTWFRYRFKTNKFNEKRYLFETYNPPYYNDFLEQIGYTVDKKYYSQDIDDLRDFLLKTTQKYEDTIIQNMVIRPFNIENYDEEMHSLYRLTINSFQSNYLYSPIDFDSFSQLYAPYKSIINPNYFAIAEDDQKMIGFLFCIPDYFDALSSMHGSQSIFAKIRFLYHKKRASTFLAKSMAVLPEYRNTGVGTALMHFCHRNAFLDGFKKGRHCLFIEDNYSSSFSKSKKTPWEYAIFKKVLA